jgi:hypothetical protein
MWIRILWDKGKINAGTYFTDVREYLDKNIGGN